MTSKYTNPKEGQISNKLIELDHKIQLNAVRITIHVYLLFKCLQTRSMCLNRYWLLALPTIPHNIALFEKLKDAGHLPQLVHGTVRGGLSNKAREASSLFIFYVISHF
jgi:hypothetical protein